MLTRGKPSLMFSLPRLNVYLNVRFALYNIFANKDPNTDLDRHREEENLQQLCFRNVWIIFSC